MQYFNAFMLTYVVAMSIDILYVPPQQLLITKHNYL